MTACRAVLFDLDGTLLNTLDDLADAVNSVLEARRLPQHPVEAYRHFVGDGATVLMTRVLPNDHRDADTVAACVSEFTRAYAEHWNVKTRPYPEIPELLDGLAARDVRMAVLSNKPHAYTRLCVEQILAGWTFEVVLGQGDDVPRKPDPAGALQVASQMHLRPEHFLYVGDTGTDMQTAVAAGMYPLGVMWGFRTREELLAHGSRTLAESPTRILKLIDAWRVLREEER
jgi:phosphoglycolate phosphatase